MQKIRISTEIEEKETLKDQNKLIQRNNKKTYIIKKNSLNLIKSIKRGKRIIRRQKLSKQKGRKYT